MRPRPLMFTGLVLGSLAAGCHVDGDELEGRPGRDEIQAGFADAADPAVGLIWRKSSASNAFCTGVLIAPDIVLTAAHCTISHSQDEPTYHFFLGAGVVREENADALLPGMSGYDVDDVVRYPDYHASPPCPWQSVDVALLHLGRRVQGVAPLHSASTGPLPAGTRCQVVGFGAHDTGYSSDVGQKRKATVRMLSSDGFNAKAAMVDGIPDHGDSGGPLLHDGAVVGVARCHDDGTWPDHRVEYFTRTDTIVGWLSDIATTRWEAP